MNFNRLRYIVAVDKNSNFSRVAEECRVAQSILRKGIQQLEKEFDSVVFDRAIR